MSSNRVGGKKKLVIIGAGGHAKVVADTALETGQYSKLEFRDTCYLRGLLEFMGFPVVGDCGFFPIEPEARYFVAIGSASIRKRISCEIAASGGVFATLIHPAASVSDFAILESGTVVMPGAVVNAGAHIGFGSIINTCASVDHDCLLGSYVHVAVGAHVAGSVRIEDEAWIGAGATVSNNVSICEGSVVGAGAVVVSDIEKPGTYIGVPAKLMSEDSRRRI
ncbi:acetyltransferase [uncultured Adlercreutzia sp.]|uniref:acetyltransferase n=1 Tax=uncultured Adlercreutzia sp. TaxID=875803 RepID=UPI0025F85654|nr:acetyltransferase [uncultured Adlercreutzia sp.]